MAKEVKETKEYKYEMRNLKAKDVFAMSKILKKMNIKNDLDPTGKTQAQFGQEFFMTILENIGNAEDEFNAFFADLVGISKEEFAELGFDEVFEILEQFKEQDGIKRFLQLLK